MFRYLLLSLAVFSQVQSDNGDPTKLITWRGDGSDVYKEKRALLLESFALWGDSTCLSFDNADYFGPQLGRMYFEAGLGCEEIVLYNDYYSLRTKTDPSCLTDSRVAGRLIGISLDLFVKYYPQYGFYRSTSNASEISLVERVKLERINVDNYVPFKTAKSVNAALCADSCEKQLNCSHGGYTSPRYCDQCVCPPGFAGDACTEKSTAIVCGPSELVATSEEQTFELQGNGKCFFSITSPEDAFTRVWVQLVNFGPTIKCPYRGHTTCRYCPHPESKHPCDCPKDSNVHVDNNDSTFFTYCADTDGFELFSEKFARQYDVEYRSKYSTEKLIVKFKAVKFTDRIVPTPIHPPPAVVDPLADEYGPWGECTVLEPSDIQTRVLGGTFPAAVIVGSKCGCCSRRKRHHLTDSRRIMWEYCNTDPCWAVYEKKAFCCDLRIRNETSFENSYCINKRIRHE